ncbi:MAG TPA: type II CAAX endopeptidase family protein [Microthrixaceae bacterium]|nr:type II CAAX endopeptidase family protein [Microthrixaceae bacterium]
MTRRWGLLDAVLAVAVAILGGSIVAGIVGGDDTLAQRFLINVPLWLAYVGVPLWATTTKGDGPVEELGLRFAPIDALIGLVAGTALQLGVIPLIYWALGDLVSQAELEEPARELVDLTDGPGWVLLVIMVLVLAPFAEELFYRGLIMRSVARLVPMWVSVIITAALFALMHFQTVQLPGLFAFGLAAGALAAWTGRLGTSMATHFVFNAWAIWEVARL